MFKLNKEEGKTNFLFPLGMLYCMALVIPIVLAYRPVALGPFSSIPGGALIFPSTYLFGDIITEIYGYRIARQILWSSIFAEILFALSVTAIVHAPYPSGWLEYSTYIEVLGNCIRFVAASILGTTISEFINIYLISKSKLYYQGKYFLLRSIYSSITGEAILTLIVYSITFIGVVPISQVLRLMINGYIYKVIFSIVCIVPATLSVAYIKKKENVDVYDHGINFNPFIFRL